MPRSLHIAILTGCCLGAWIGNGRLSAGEPTTVTDPVAEGRAALERGDDRAAVRILEGALADAAPADRTARLTALRDAYTRGIDVATRANRSADADEYRDCLAILNRKPKAASPPTNTPVVAAPAEANPAKPAATPARESPRPPAPLPAPESAAGATTPPVTPTAPTTPPPASTPPAPNASPGDGPPAPVPGAAPAQRDAAVVQAGLATEVPAAAPAATAPTAPAASEATNPATAPVDPTAATLKAADAAFRSKDYESAGRGYAELFQAQRLPANRHPAWAYCRRHAVVQRINQGPRSRPEWDAIRGEVREIRRLHPSQWYDEYLLSFIEEHARVAPPAAAGSSPILRTSSPDEEVPHPLPGGTPDQRDELFPETQGR